MNAIARSAETVGVAEKPFWMTALHRAKAMLVQAVDGLAPVRRRGDYRDPPPEWYQFPPY